MPLPLVNIAAEGLVDGAEVHLCLEQLAFGLHRCTASNRQGSEERPRRQFCHKHQQATGSQSRQMQ